MGWLSNLWSKVKGVAGRVLGTVAKVAKPVAGILGRVSKVVPIPYASNIAKGLDVAGDVAQKIVDSSGSGSS